MKIFISYQDIDGGTKNATEEIIHTMKKLYPQHTFFIYKQRDPVFKGVLQYTRHLVWSIFDFQRVINSQKLRSIDAIYFNIYSFSIAQFFSHHRNTPSFFHFHGNQEFVKNLHSEKSFLPEKMYNKLLGTIVESLQRFSFRRSQKICFVSEFAKKEFIQQHKMQEFSHKTITIPNGVNLKKFSLTSQKQIQRFKKRLQITKANSKIVLYSGRIDEKKGIHKIINALLLYPKKNIHVCIIYPKLREKQSLAYKKFLERLIHKNRLGNKVHFFENPSTISSFYQMADLVILPSEREYFSLVLLESFACGTPFMGSKVGFIPEFLNKIDKKLILSHNSAREIAKKLRWFFGLSDKEKNKIIQTGHTISKNFTWDKTAKKIVLQLKNLSEQNY